ncbi:carbonic anhydrase 2-like isoform X1 [Herrania umbratica]|uniref:Carbonic anhydrase n=1 Tax=Herrania umbratica TaxID=108875 RepID=A0A6J1AZM8_9ROSI|nr:carbonic anhydrase 2-like isoform X1 [Herrania umbratica]
MEMAKHSAEVVVEGLKKILISCREREGLDQEVQGKVERLIAELQGKRPPFDPDARRIEDGFDFFKKNIYDQHPDYFRELAEGQHPRFLVFSCSDSRVSPSVVLNFKPGEAFGGRNIANMVPQFDQLRHTEIGSVIEYAVKALEVQNILVMGHSRCGGIERLMKLPDKSTTYDFIDQWVQIGLPAKLKVLAEANDLTFEEQCRLCEKESVKNSMANLLTYPFVRNAVVSGTLTLRGGYYDFVNGTFEQWKMCTEPMPPMPMPF